MNRALKILSIAVILFLAYMWVSILYKSCNKNSEFDGFEEELVEDSNEVPALSDDYEDEPFFNDETEEEDTQDSDSSDPIDYDELDQKIEETQNEQKKEVKTAPTKPVSDQNQSYTDSGDEGGRYMVIAGSYILESNADQMVKKLEGMGYSNPEKVVFDLSQFHSVCAGRYNDYTKAVQVSSELKRRGVDNYVHKRK